MSTLNEMSKMLGREGTIGINGMRIPVRIMDVKQVYGATRYLVAPIGGTGQAWVEASRVTLPAK